MPAALMIGHQRRDKVWLAGAHEKTPHIWITQQALG
jgi:hypothetical protein